MLHTLGMRMAVGTGGGGNCPPPIFCQPKKLGV